MEMDENGVDLDKQKLDFRKVDFGKLKEISYVLIALRRLCECVMGIDGEIHERVMLNSYCPLVNKTEFNP